MQELSVGDPRAYETDIGPVIDAQAKEEWSFSRICGCSEAFLAFQSGDIVLFAGNLAS